VALAPDVPTSEDPALRRPSPPRTWRDRLEQLADATGTTPARILVGGAAAICAGLAALWLTRPPAAPPEVSLPFASTTVALAAASTTDTDATVVVVHVAGAVVAPGVHTLPAGSRVVDAIEAAGGLTAEADGSRINLAAPLTDGERVYVPKVGEVAPAPVAGASAGLGAGGPASGPVNLNDADEAALDALPGVGPATAAAIIEHRNQIGHFTSVDQLLDVRGIGEAKLEQLRPLVTV
jgi:competence protein ComEA